MYSLLRALIYLAFISLGLPDSLLGSGWPVMHAELGVPVSYMGVVSIVISCGTIVSSLLSDKLTRKLGTGGVTAASVLLTVLGLLIFHEVLGAARLRRAVRSRCGRDRRGAQ